MEEEVFRILREKKFFTPDDISSLILLCDRLFERNREIAVELRTALENLGRVHGRIDFYRKATMKEMK